MKSIDKRNRISYNITVENKKEEKKMKKLKAALPAIAILAGIAAINVLIMVAIGTSNLPDWVKFLLLSK